MQVCKFKCLSALLKGYKIKSSYQHHNSVSGCFQGGKNIYIYIFKYFSSACGQIKEKCHLFQMSVCFVREDAEENQSWTKRSTWVVSGPAAKARSRASRAIVLSARRESPRLSRSAAGSAFCTPSSSEVGAAN